jgi:serine O-acetyltransferase
MVDSSGRRLAEANEGAIEALSASGDDALSKADAEGYPDWDDAVAWTERAKALVLHQRDRAALRSEIPALGEGLLRLLERVERPDGPEPEAVLAGFLERLPAVRALLAEDVEAAFEGDPAANSFGEILVAYPSIHAIAIYRLAHELYLLRVPQLPRVMTEHAHSRTGIDINPGARIGRRFFIDHGTGVVIGETSEIGDRVRLYQGVTLGAFSPRRGQTIRGLKRHPTIEDDVTIYAGVTILGGETVIGAGTVVNGNAYVTESVPPNSRVVPDPPRHMVRHKVTPDDEDQSQLHWDI